MEQVAKKHNDPYLHESLSREMGALSLIQVVNSLGVMSSLSQALQMWDFTVPLMLYFLFPENFMPSATILFGNTLYLFGGVFLISYAWWII